MPDYEKIIVELLAHFIEMENTDHLNPKGYNEAANFPMFSAEEVNVITRLRDEARKSVGWQGY